MTDDLPDGARKVIESGPYVADASGVYTRQRGAEQWWMIALCLLGVGLMALLPVSLEQRMHASLSLVIGCGIGSVLATYWRRRRPLPLVLLQGEILLCFSPGVIPKLLARFPTDTVTSVALSPSPAGIQLEWLFRGGEQGRFTLSPDPRLALPLAHFLGGRFGNRFKDHRA
ncbi:MAG: hypothetical protein IPO66_22100 [Rhodanobacteraceae bacterium]|nr:hypothetical protein [Rhodanobacteraceae bacterium]